MNKVILIFFTRLADRRIIFWLGAVISEHYNAEVSLETILIQLGVARAPPHVSWYFFIAFLGSNL